MFKFNSGNNNQSYNDWYNHREDQNKKLEKIPSITNVVNGKKRYYSAIDAELYFGDIFIDEVSNIAWTIQQQALPIFGYNSYTFDDIAVGSRLIQGQFAINFTERNYLQTLQKNSSFQKIARRMYGEDIEAKVTYSDFREKLHLPKWDKGFDIVIGFGKNNSIKNNNGTSIYSTYVVIDCVQITGSSIQLDDNGDRILEMYSFIARDVKDSFADTTENSGGNSIDNSMNNSTNKQNSKLNLYANLNLNATTNQLQITSSEEVVFSEGNLQFAGTYKNKIISSVITLTPENNNLNLTSTLSSQLISSLKKECGSKPYIIATVKYKYINKYSETSNKMNSIQEEVTLKINLTN